MLSRSEEGQLGRFWGVVFTHIDELGVMDRNRRGKDRRHYSDFDVYESVEFPCGCKPRSGQSRRFRLYEDGALVHHGCSVVFVGHDKEGKLKQSMLQRAIWTKRSIVLQRVTKPSKPSPRVPLYGPYGSPYFVRR